MSSITLPPTHQANTEISVTKSNMQSEKSKIKVKVGFTSQQGFKMTWHLTKVVQVVSASANTPLNSTQLIYTTKTPSCYSEFSRHVLKQVNTTI